MPKFIIKTVIHAPVEVCFDLARSIDLHIESMQGTSEKAIAGVTSGLIGAGRQVTWRARHFGIFMKLTSKIVTYQFPHAFTDEMISGPFQMMRHKHQFKQEKDHTLLVDEFEFESPGGILGRFINAVILTRYMKSLLKKRNITIKSRAELARNITR